MSQGMVWPSRKGIGQLRGRKAGGEVKKVGDPLAEIPHLGAGGNPALKSCV